MSRSYDGNLEARNERDTVGLVWFFRKAEKDCTSPFIRIKDGQHLTIYQDDDRTQVVFNGDVSLDFKIDAHKTAQHPHRKLQVACGAYINGIQRNFVGPNRWTYLFSYKKPATLVVA